MFIPSKKLNSWWLLITTQIVGLVLAYRANLHVFVWENDITFITSVVMVLWIIVTVRIGLEIYQKTNSTDQHWFMADACLSLGMIGTVIGFIFMLSTTFSDLNPQDLDSMRQAIGIMAAGMGTALLTTLAGLLASLSIKLQLVLQDS